VCTFQLRPYHTALPGYVYGGLIASLIDRHATGTAAAAAYRAAGRAMDTKPPTPIEDPLEIQARW
jgi:acyl-coenzyme A thioesterase PaaI-like protein